MQTFISSRKDYKPVRSNILLKRFENKKIKRISGEYFRYCIIGVIVTAIDFGFLSLMVECLHIHYLLAASVSYITAAIIHYFLSAQYVFVESSAEKNLNAFWIFLLLGIAGLVFYEILMWLFVNFLDIHYLIAKVIATGFSFTFNFLSRKYLLFR